MRYVALADETGLPRPYGLEEMNVTGTRTELHAARPQPEAAGERHGRRIAAVAAAIFLVGLAVLAATLIWAGSEPSRLPVFVPAASVTPAHGTSMSMPGMPGMQMRTARPHLRAQAARYGIVSGP